MNHDELTHLDLFSGIGGFALAANAAGFRTVGFCEIEPYAQQVLREKFHTYSKPERLQGSTGEGLSGTGGASIKSPRLHSDIYKLDGRDYAGVTVLTGGFPCQPFSVAGQQRGAADDRHLWPEMLRVIKEARPTWIIGENVPGIIPMELDNCISGLEACGYEVQPLVIPACAVDAKHRRDRLWILAHRANERSPRRNAGNEYAGDVGQPPYAWKNEEQWFAESGMGRVANGIPARVDRLKGLGNAIVPQVAEPFFHWIRQIEQGEIT